MWEENDRKNYENHINNRSGQINNDIFSYIIRYFSRDINNLTFLEIGTWNGLGSTKQFVEVLESREDDYIFYSLECNIDKSEYAKNLYKNNAKIHILNEVIFNNEPKNFYEVFPQCKSNELYKKWNDVDMINMKKCELFLERKDLPDIFDVILLDGGEFTTYFEFQILKDRCKYLMLDDINVAKCTKIVEEIKSEPEKWEIITENTTTRNGFMICKNLSNF